MSPLSPDDILFPTEIEHLQQLDLSSQEQQLTLRTEHAPTWQSSSHFENNCIKDGTGEAITDSLRDISTELQVRVKLF